MNEWMNECLTPQHENYIGYWVSDNGIWMKRAVQNKIITIILIKIDIKTHLKKKKYYNVGVDAICLSIMLDLIKTNY